MIGPVAPSLTGRLLQRVVRLCCARPALTVVVAVGLRRARRRLRGAFPDARHVQVPPAPAPPAVRHALQGLRRGLRPARGHRRGRAEPGRRDLHGLRGPPGQRPTRRRPRDGAHQLSDRRQPPRSARAAVPAARHAARHSSTRSPARRTCSPYFAATPTLDRLVDGINQYVGATFLPGVFGPGTEEKANTAPTRLLRDLLTQMSERIDGRPYRSPWGSLFATSDPRPGRRLLLVARPPSALCRDRSGRHAAHLRRGARDDPRRPACDRESPPAVSLGRGRRHGSARALQ